MRPTLLLFLLSIACTRSFIEDEKRVVIHRDLVYAVVDGRELELDLYLPADRTSRTPLVLWMHGGSWMYGTHHDCRVDWLAEEGFAVASIAYRKSLEAKWPAQLHDTKAAVRWLRAHAGQYRLRTDRMAAAGMSSGAHLALMLGLKRDEDEAEHEHPSSVDAVISYYGPTDLAWYGATSRTANWWGQPIPTLLGVAPRDDPERARDASPIYQIRRDSPPVLLIHGEDDHLVPKTQSETFHQRYREASLSSRLVLVADAGHYG
ncbi:MAG: alpha/beta hydrolase fold domain-containing protein, partial [Planctomycetota bacterium]